MSASSPADLTSSASGTEKTGTSHDAARASAERYDFASAFVGSMLCATWFVMRGQSVETACGIVFCATITAVVAEELLQDVERDGGGR